MLDGPSGQIGVHHACAGVWILDARDCSHRWVVFHETYSFCLVHKLQSSAFAEWRYNGRLYVTNVDSPVAMMQPGETHANLRRTPPADFITVQVDPQLVSRIAENLGGPTRAPSIAHPHPSSSDPAVTRALHRFRHLLCEDLFTGRPQRCTCHLQSALFEEALVELVAAAFDLGRAERAGGPSSTRSAPVERALRYLRAHAASAYDLDALERAAGCGRHYLLHLFRREIGATPSEIHNRILVSKVCRMLVSAPNASLDEIIREVGWPGARTDADPARKVSLMIRHFRRALGMTPGQFRSGLRRAALEGETSQSAALARAERRRVGPS